MTVDSKSLLLNEIKKAWPVERWIEFGVVVAVSGGADSVSLLRALHEIRTEAIGSLKEGSGEIHVAHFNHKLRGSESDADCEFVKKLAEGLGLQFLSECSDVSSSSENVLRDERYRFLEDTARKTNSRYIVTAHHRDDQIETVLFRLFRGTGTKGLAGIPESRVVDESLTIVRPMLSVEHREIFEALRSWNQPFRSDATNFQSNYTRNFIRNDVLPLVRTRFDSVDDAIARLAAQAAQQQDYLGEQAKSFLSCTVMRPDRVSIDCKGLGDISPVIIREMLVTILKQQGWLDSQLGFDELDRVSGLMRGAGEQPKFQLPGCINCQKHGEVLTFWK